MANDATANVDMRYRTSAQ